MMTGRGVTGCPKRLTKNKSFYYARIILESKGKESLSCLSPRTDFSPSEFSVIHDRVVCHDVEGL